MIRGIDVSHYQGVVNWQTKRTGQGLSFGMAKCTQGDDFFDSQYVANREGCHRAGLPFIAYHYAEPGTSSALTQVKRFIAKAGTVEGYCLDLEVSSLSQGATNAWQRAFGDDLRALTGKPTIIYLGGYAANGSGQGAVDHFDHWMYPHYTVTHWPTVFAPQVGGNTTGWKVPPAPSIWQCSDNIAGTDASVSNLTPAQLFSGADMPLTAADAELIWSHLLTPSTGTAASAEAFLTQANIKAAAARDAAQAALAILNGTDSDGQAALVAAFVKALPPAAAGGLTTDQVKQAVKDALKEGIS